MNFETEGYSPRKSTNLKVKMGLVNLENKFKLLKIGAFNEIKMSSLQNKLQRFSFSLGKPRYSIKRRNSHTKKITVKNSIKMLVKNFEAKLRISFLKLKLNKMKKRNENPIKEKNHLLALAMCTKALYESKMRKFFRLMKYCYLVNSDGYKLKSSNQMFVSTIIPNSESKSNYSISQNLKQSNYFIRPSHDIEKKNREIRKSRSRDKIALFSKNLLQNKKSSSKSISIKSENIKRDSVSSVSFHYEMKAKIENETRVKKSVRIMKGLSILKKMEKNKILGSLG